MWISDSVCNELKINAVLLNYLFIKELSCFPQMCTHVFNTDNIEPNSICGPMLHSERSSKIKDSQKFRVIIAQHVCCYDPCLLTSLYNCDMKSMQHCAKTQNCLPLPLFSAHIKTTTVSFLMLFLFTTSACWWHFILLYMCHSVVSSCHHWTVDMHVLPEFIRSMPHSVIRTAMIM